MKEFNVKKIFTQTFRVEAENKEEAKRKASKGVIDWRKVNRDMEAEEVGK